VYPLKKSSLQPPPKKNRGYAPRGTQSVVAGLTAALWDLENAKVEDGALAPAFFG
jgi:hypothetical protein